MASLEYLEAAETFNPHVAALLAVQVVSQVLEEACVIANAADESAGGRPLLDICFPQRAPQFMVAGRRSGQGRRKALDAKCQPWRYLSTLKSLRSGRLSDAYDEISFLASRDDSYDVNENTAEIGANVVATSTPQKLAVTDSPAVKNENSLIGQGDEEFESSQTELSTSMFINHLFDMSEVERVIFCDDNMPILDRKLVPSDLTTEAILMTKATNTYMNNTYNIAFVEEPLVDQPCYSFLADAFVSDYGKNVVFMIDDDDRALVNDDVASVSDNVALVADDMTSVDMAQDNVALVEYNVVSVNHGMPLVNESLSMTMCRDDIVNDNVALINDVALVTGDVAPVNDNMTLVNDDVAPVSNIVALVNDNVASVNDDVALVSGKVAPVKDDIALVNDDVPLVSNDKVLVIDNAALVSYDVSPVNYNVALVKDDVDLVNDDVARINYDVSQVNYNVALVKDDVDLVNDDVALINYDVSPVNDNVALVNVDVALVNDNAALVNDDVALLNYCIPLINDNETLINDDVDLVKDDVVLIKYDISQVNDNVALVNDEVARVNDDIALIDVALVCEDIATGNNDTSKEVLAVVNTVVTVTNTTKDDQDLKKSEYRVELLQANDINVEKNDVAFYENAYLTLNRDEQYSDDEGEHVVQDPKEMILQEVELSTTSCSDEEVVMNPLQEKRKELTAMSGVSGVSHKSKGSMLSRCRSQGARLLSCLRGWWRRKIPGKRRNSKLGGRKMRMFPLSPDARRRASSLMDHRDLYSPSPSRSMVWKFNTVNEILVKSSRWKDYAFDVKPDECGEFALI